MMETTAYHKEMVFIQVAKEAAALVPNDVMEEELLEESKTWAEIHKAVVGNTIVRRFHTDEGKLYGIWLYGFYNVQPEDRRILQRAVDRSNVRSIYIPRMGNISKPGAL